MRKLGIGRTVINGQGYTLKTPSKPPKSWRVRSAQLRRTAKLRAMKLAELAELRR